MLETSLVSSIIILPKKTISDAGKLIFQKQPREVLHIHTAYKHQEIVAKLPVLENTLRH